MKRRGFLSLLGIAAPAAGVATVLPTSKGALPVGPTGGFDYQQAYDTALAEFNRHIVTDAMISIGVLAASDCPTAEDISFGLRMLERIRAEDPSLRAMGLHWALASAIAPSYGMQGPAYTHLDLPSSTDEDLIYEAMVLCGGLKIARSCSPAEETFCRAQIAKLRAGGIAATPLRLATQIAPYLGRPIPRVSY